MSVCIYGGWWLEGYFIYCFSKSHKKAEESIILKIRYFRKQILLQKVEDNLRNPYLDAFNKM